MRKVFLLTGFNNWGKTELIKSLFNKGRFIKSQLHTYSGKDFFVLPNSNDDLGEGGYIYEYQDRLQILKNHGIVPDLIFSAFCPTKERTNDSSRIISTLYAKDRVYVIPIIHKWCLHAKLDVTNISSFYSSLANVSIHPVSSKNIGAQKLSELQKVINPLI